MTGENAAQLWTDFLEKSIVDARMMGVAGILTAADIRDEFEAFTGGKYSDKYGMLLDDN